MALSRKLAFIDLSTGSVEIETISSELPRNFLEGRGMNMYLLSRCYSCIPDPFSPQNPLISGIRKRAERCPFKALPVLGENAYHCNLCGGKPRCIKICTPGAITLLK